MRSPKLWIAVALVAAAAAALFLLSEPEGDDDELDLANIELKGPVPYPQAKPLQGTRIRKFDLGQLLVYKALPAYTQPKWLDELVARGTLPPVAKRLPAEPQVILTAAMSDGPGEYGGVWRDVSACPTEGWNWGAGQSQGAFGIDRTVQESLVCSGPIYLRKDKLEPLPNLARDWEWSPDGLKLTMRLLSGAKWSDGHPFSSADVMFTWKDLILDPKVRSYTSRTSWQIDGKDVHLRAVDEHTIEWTFPVPRPVQMLFKMDEMDFGIAPMHVLKPHHPRYNPSADYIGFEDCLPPQNLPPVVLGPWVPVHYKTDELLIMRRNPYYWKVDQKGRQLPYLDEVVFEKATDGVRRTLNTLAGSGDHTNVENPSTFIETVKRAAAPGAPFRISWGPELLGFSLTVNQSLDLGVKDTRDEQLRRLFRDVRFRRALSQAIDRKSLCQAIVRGDFLRPWPGGLLPGSPYFRRESVVVTLHPSATIASGSAGSVPVWT